MPRESIHHCVRRKLAIKNLAFPSSTQDASHDMGGGAGNAQYELLQLFQQSNNWPTLPSDDSGLLDQMKKLRGIKNIKYRSMASLIWTIQKAS